MKKIFINILLILCISTQVYAIDEYTTILGFQLEKNNLLQIQKKLGDAPIKLTGDAGGTTYRLCYISKRNNVTITFMSGELGGDNYELLGFSVMNSIEKSQECGEIKLKDNWAENTNIGVIRLGKNFISVANELPKPIQNIPGGIQYQHIKKIPFTKEQIIKLKVEKLEYAFWSELTTIRVFNKNDTVSGYEVWKVTTW
jgi:hypothetical protein